MTIKLAFSLIKSLSLFLMKNFIFIAAYKIQRITVFKLNGYSKLFKPYLFENSKIVNFQMQKQFRLIEIKFTIPVCPLPSYIFISI